MRYLLFSLLCLVLAGCGLDETLHRSDKPLSLEEANKDIWIASLPFPSSTTNVYYFYHSGGMQEYEFLVRFTVGPKDLDGAVGRLLSGHDSSTKEHHSYTFVPIAAAPRSPDFSEYPPPMTWWSPNSITNGYYRTSTSGQPFQIWVDVAQHTIYSYDSD